MFGEVLTVLTIALAAGEATASINVPPHFSRTPGGRPHTTTTTSGNGPDVTHISAVGTASCAAESWSGSISASKNAYVSAVAKVVADLCTYPWWEDFETLYVGPLYDFAIAYARAYAEVSAACVTTVSGSATAKGCAYTAAYAEATAEAYAVAHAEAAAAASTQCSCGKDFVAVYADAAAVIVLWAEAHAAATAAACAQGNQASSAYAYVDCYAEVIVHVIAKAAAKAFAAADCWPKQDSIAIAEVTAAVDAWVVETDKCTITEGSFGNAGTGTGGSSGTGFVQYV